MPFLSLLDDRAKPKGSRDPLGFELVWTHYGRQIIGNLTTVTSSLNNFAVALLGFRWANEIHTGLPPNEQQSRIRETFLRYEQLAGYLRYLAGEREIMGITRVTRRIESADFQITLGMAADEQILSDQTSYGLWGLYSTAMRDSGLVKGDIRQTTSIGQQISGLIEEKLDKELLIDLILSNSIVDRRVMKKHADKFLQAMLQNSVQDQLLGILMQGGDNQVLQKEIWLLTRQLAEGDKLHDGVPEFLSSIKSMTGNTMLIDRLVGIESIERLLVAANNLFHYCRRKDGEKLSALVKMIEGRYIYSHLSSSLDLSAIPRGESLEKIRAAFMRSDVESAIREVLLLNRDVMAHRDGAPWVELEPDNTLRVRVPSETVELRSQESLETHWDYEYFVSSFLKIANKALG